MRGGDVSVARHKGRWQCRTESFFLNLILVRMIRYRNKYDLTMIHKSESQQDKDMTNHRLSIIELEESKNTQFLTSRQFHGYPPSGGGIERDFFVVGKQHDVLKKTTMDKTLQITLKYDWTHQSINCCLLLIDKDHVTDCVTKRKRKKKFTECYKDPFFCASVPPGRDCIVYYKRQEGRATLLCLFSGSYIKQTVKNGKRSKNGKRKTDVG